MLGFLILMLEDLGIRILFARGMISIDLASLKRNPLLVQRVISSVEIIMLD